jgi:HEPN domain-containing protein
VILPETRLWWEQARRDLRVAEKNHAAKDYDVAVFFSEQSVQKALKALLLHRTSRMPPKTHNLVRLGELAGVDHGMSQFLAELAPHYIRTRYPDAAGQVTNKLYRGRLSLHFLRGAQKVMKWCRSRLR